MAIYRTVQMEFWTDPKVIDDFTPEDKYFYLYLITNPHTNLIGCYEISLRQMSDETGYTRETIEKLIDRFVNIHQVIKFSKTNKEILLLNWNKHNWTKSEKLDKPLVNQYQEVKTVEFKKFLAELLGKREGVQIPYQYGMDTTVTVTNTNTETYIYEEDINSNSNDSNNSNKYKYYPTDSLLDEAFADFVLMRKKIKKPMTERAVKMMITRLNNLSGGDNDLAIQILEQSIRNCWQDVYELKDKDKKSKPSSSANGVDDWLNA